MVSAGGDFSNLYGRTIADSVPKYSDTSVRVLITQKPLWSGDICGSGMITIC